VPSVMGKRFECEQIGAQFMVTKAGAGDLSCVEASGDDANLLGKRYHCAQCGAMVLCTKAGPGKVSCDSVPMDILTAKTLPSSD
jgi:hypothetical protein